MISSTPSICFSQLVHGEIIKDRAGRLFKRDIYGLALVDTGNLVKGTLEYDWRENIREK